MPLQILRGDITLQRVDAIVNAANASLLGGGGVDGAIHRAAGPGLLEECRLLGGGETGEAKATGAYALEARYVIHTVGPVWHGGAQGEEALLTACYENSLRLAEELGCESIAFPLISSGVYGYPVGEALGVAARAIRRFLEHSDMEVRLVLFYGVDVPLPPGVEAALQERLDAAPFSAEPSERLRAPTRRDAEFKGRVYLRTEVTKKDSPTSNYDPKALQRPDRSESRTKSKRSVSRDKRDTSDSSGSERSASSESRGESISSSKSESSVSGGSSPRMRVAPGVPPELDRLLARRWENFSQALLRLIDERGLSDSECYKKANIDRRHFSKIRSNPNYRPSRSTVLAFAVALRLDRRQTRDLLLTAGYALSFSSKTDIIVGYFIDHGCFDIDEINRALFHYDLPLLGAVEA